MSKSKELTIRLNRDYIRQRLVTCVEFGLRKGQYAPAVRALEDLRDMLEEESEERPKRIEVQIVDGRVSHDDETE